MESSDFFAISGLALAALVGIFFYRQFKHYVISTRRPYLAKKPISWYGDDKWEPKRVEIEWGTLHNKPLHAYIEAPMPPEDILDQAKWIVDQALPQSYGKYGGHWYSLRGRENLLNHILWFYYLHKELPSGWVCFVNEWHHSWIEGVRGSGWALFKHIKNGYKPGFWYRLPEVPDDALQSPQSRHIHI